MKSLKTIYFSILVLLAITLHQPLEAQRKGKGFFGGLVSGGFVGALVGGSKGFGVGAVVGGAVGLAAGATADKYARERNNDYRNYDRLLADYQQLLDRHDALRSELRTYGVKVPRADRYRYQRYSYEKLSRRYQILAQETDDLEDRLYNETESILVLHEITMNQVPVYYA